AVVKVFVPLPVQSIAVYPNPVKDGIINLQLVHQPKGLYGVRLINANGETILTKVIQYEGGNGSEKISIQKIAKGIYSLEIIKPDGEIISNKLVY
ncbi:MAG: T9SS type A sorting domain-containing protein, partial [Ginsengibacter sp.]